MKIWESKAQGRVLIEEGQPVSKELGVVSVKTLELERQSQEKQVERWDKEEELSSEMP